MSAEREHRARAKKRNPRLASFVPPVIVNNRSPQESASVWWLHPLWMLSFPVAALALIAFLLPESAYLDNWHTAKAFDSSSLGFCVAVATMFAMGCLLASWLNASFASRRRFPAGPRDPSLGARELQLLFAGAFAVTIVGYLIWFGMILSHGGIGMFANLLMGGEDAPYILKESANESAVTGVTTVTQFGMGTAMLGTYVGFTQGWRRVRLRLLVLFVFAGIRAVFVSERISLIEIVLPSVILLVRLMGNGRPGSTLRRFLLVAPVVGIVGLYALFTLTEYFRSWSSFYAGRDDQSLFAFTLLRLLGYYVTALNNGAVYWQEHGAIYFPYFTMGWLWKFPVIGETLQTALGGTASPSEVQTALLKAEANPEFNNSTGIFPIFMDFGTLGALAYFVLYGFLAALLYQSYRRGSIVGLFLYSFMVTGLIDQTRILYLHSGRAFPTWILLFLVVLVARSKLRRKTFSNALPERPAATPACGNPLC